MKGVDGGGRTVIIGAEGKFAEKKRDEKAEGDVKMIVKMRICRLFGGLNICSVHSLYIIQVVHHCTSQRYTARSNKVIAPKINGI